MKSICFLAQFPPPIHGLSKAVDTLYKSYLKDKYNLSKIDITDNKKIFSSIIQLLNVNSDVIYFTPSQTKGGNLRDLVFLKIIRMRKKKCIVHIHGGYYRQLVDNDLPSWQRKMNYIAMRDMAGGVVLGNSLHYIFEGMINDDKIFICPNCVDDEFIAESIDSKMENLKHCKKLHVLYLSNFIASKGYREILELARMMQDSGYVDKFVFHFAGKFFENSEKQYFKEKSAGLKNIVFHGVVHGLKKKELLEQCHIFSLLSRYPNEGQPISILEAKGNGMAIITTDHAGIPEIASNESGYVCAKNNIKVVDLFRYMLDCYEDRGFLVDVCHRNWDSVRLKYTEGQYIENIDKIFDTVCKM